MDLRTYNPNRLLIEKLYNEIDYQPFLLSDDLRIGVAHHLVYESNIKKMNKKDVSAKSWNHFNNLNDNLKKMYDDWIFSLINFVGKNNLKYMSIVDIGCNSGYFLFNIKKLGAKKCVGFDLTKFSYPIEIISKITGLNIEFNDKQYSSLSHVINNYNEIFDIVIASTVILHVSDPLYFLNYLGSITKRTLFIFGPFPDNGKFNIEYSKIKSRNPFPSCFEYYTRISYPLLVFSLKELGFKYIKKLPYQKDWITKDWYLAGNYNAIIASKDNYIFSKL